MCQWLFRFTVPMGKPLPPDATVSCPLQPLQKCPIWGLAFLTIAGNLAT